jgi:hypothetical protein
VVVLVDLPVSPLPETVTVAAVKVPGATNLFLTISCAVIFGFL